MAKLENMSPQQLIAMASQLGLGKGNSDIKEAAQKLSGKSDEELIQEVRKLKVSLSEDKEKFQKQLNSLKMMRNMLNEEQKIKFDQIMKILTEE